jgi:hypothetical protein
MAGGRGFPGRVRVPRRELVPRRGCVARPHPAGRWHGLLARAAGRAGRSPARTPGRVRPCRVAGPWRRRSRAARRRPGRGRLAARRAARHRRPERLPGTRRPRSPCRPRPVGEPGGPGRSRGARCAPVAGHVDQAARRVHGRRIQHSPPLTARPRRCRAVPVTRGPVAGRAPGLSRPGERENQQRNQADDETRHAQSHAETGDATVRAPADQVGGRARHDQDPARHDHHGADYRQRGDKPHPPGRGGIRAHRSTIASRFAPRKPYRQVRLSRLALGAVTTESFGELWPSPRSPGDTLWP